MTLFTSLRLLPITFISVMKTKTWLRLNFTAAVRWLLCYGKASGNKTLILCYICKLIQLKTVYLDTKLRLLVFHFSITSVLDC